MQDGLMVFNNVRPADGCSYGTMIKILTEILFLRVGSLVLRVSVGVHN